MSWNMYLTRYVCGNAQMSMDGKLEYVKDSEIDWDRYMNGRPEVPEDEFGLPINPVRIYREYRVGFWQKAYWLHDWFDKRLTANHGRLTRKDVEDLRDECLRAYYDAHDALMPGWDHPTADTIRRTCRELRENHRNSASGWFALPEYMGNAIAKHFPFFANGTDRPDWHTLIRIGETYLMLAHALQADADDPAERWEYTAG